MYKSFLFLVLSLAFATHASAEQNPVNSGYNIHVAFGSPVFDFSSVSEIDKSMYKRKRHRTSIPGAPRGSSRGR